MQLRYEQGAYTWLIDLGQAWDLALPVSADEGRASAWYCPPMRVEPVRAGDFVGAVASGGSVNFRNLFFNPHGNGCHTECLGHISPEGHSLLTYFRGYQGLAWLGSLQPLPHAQGDWRFNLAQIKALWAEAAPYAPSALVLRSLPNTEAKKHRQYSGTNPPYFEPAALAYLAERGLMHLLVDLPSVDREEDGGALAAHRAFWNYPQAPRYEATITELIYVPDACTDGLYWLNLQAAALDNDAAPSRPILYALCELGVRS